ncbi:MAG TPA: GlsB/YeaQ/YmgE family stress response membrane protein [Candidatus Saccharimonadales bacterium]|nr:GlsB/YeaQ/YmgE family stress response membrane protein [Candidatus Saccharimonadales bacterium]
MELLAWIAFGAFAGWIASMIVGTGEGVLGNIIVGIVGAILGGFIMNAFGQTGVTGFNFYSFGVAILGSVLLLWIYRAFAHRRV